MQIRRVKIEGFRGIRSAEFRPRRRNILIGPNNSGKSTVLEALDLVLHSGLGRPRPAPSEIDYFNRDPSAGFRIEVVLGALDDAFLALVPDHLEGWSEARGEVLAAPTGEGIEPVVRVAAVGTNDFEVLHQFAKEESEGARFGREVRQQVGWVFDGRIRDPLRQLAFYQGGLLDRLFGETDLDNAVDTLRAALGSGADAVNADAAVTPELEAIGLDLRQLGLLGAEQRPAFEIGAVSQRELLQALRLGLPSPNAKSIPIDRQGRGAQRLLLTATLLRLSRKLNRPLIGGFEEPEEALEPLRQNQLTRLLNGLVEADGQIFLATHSPDIVRAFAADDLTLLEQGKDGVAVESLADRLTTPVRQAYERRISGPIVRALFARIPVLAEGPGDVPVFDTFWTALASNKKVPPADQLGIDVIDCEGANKQPMAAAFLYAAKRRVVAWAEADVPENLLRLETDGNCKAILRHDPSAPDLESALVALPPVATIANAMASVAADRGYGWDAQRQDLLSRVGPAGLDESQRQAAAGAPDLEALLTSLPEPIARRLAAQALRGGGATPFEIKGARPARVFAEKLVEVAGVPENFAKPFTELAEWAERPTDGQRSDFYMRLA